MYAAAMTLRAPCSSDGHTLDKGVTTGAAASAGEGLQAEQGKRRSVRQHQRPLEWWRSEKKVYSRQYRSARPASQCAGSA
jgi:hypothetical protein